MTTLTTVTWHDRVALITVNRPAKRNALTVALCDELRDAVREALATGAGALVLTGEGSVFSSGADLDVVYRGEFRTALHAMLRTVAEAPVPVVASVNGPAIGAGTQLAIAADLRVVAPTSMFSVPAARLGLAVDPWTIRRLASLVGLGPARTMLLACAQLSAERALAVGLADRVGAMADALTWAGELAELAPLTLAYTKRVLGALFEPRLDPDADRVAAELAEEFEACWDSADLAEGRLARAQRRRPRFQGR